MLPKLQATQVILQLKQRTRNANWVRSQSDTLICGWRANRSHAPDQGMSADAYSQTSYAPPVSPTRSTTSSTMNNNGSPASDEQHDNNKRSAVAGATGAQPAVDAARVFELPRLRCHT